MNTVLWSILLILVLTVINGLLSMAEIAIVSARRARLQQRAETGDPKARKALELANAPDRFLSTIQVGITLVGIFAGVISGSEMTDILRAYFESIALLKPYKEILAVGLVVVAMTYLTLVIGELVPKQIGLAHSETVALTVAQPVALLSRLAAPAVWVLSHSTRAVLWLLRIRPAADTTVTEDEIKILLAQGTAAGVFEETEQDIVERVFSLGDRRVSALMTPRTDILWLDIDEPIGDAMRTMISGGHSYYPVCRGSIDDVAGMASVKEQWARMVNRQPPDIRGTLVAPLFMPATMPVFRALETFKEHSKHIALVIDEYGSICGLVTLNDVLEAIVGDVPRSDRNQELPMVQRADGSWLVDGMVTIDELRRVLEITTLPGEDRGEFHTIGGYLMRELGRIPRTTDRLESNGLRFEVMDMDGHRVDKVLITPLAPPSASDSDAQNGGNAA